MTNLERYFDDVDKKALTLNIAGTEVVIEGDITNITFNSNVVINGNVSSRFSCDGNVSITGDVEGTIIADGTINIKGTYLGSARSDSYISVNNEILI
jgi:cytoskeletal protein CcmA (bactofilin family)